LAHIAFRAESGSRERLEESSSLLPFWLAENKVPTCLPPTSLREGKSIVICVLRANNTVNALGKSGNSCRLASNVILATFFWQRQA